MVRLIILSVIAATNSADVDITFPSIVPVANGRASWYGDGNLHGNKTANGESIEVGNFTCAHRTLAFHQMILVETRRKRRVWCRVNDRGPFNSKIIDLARPVSQALGIDDTGDVILYQVSR